MLNNRYIWLIVALIAVVVMGAIVANWLARILQLGINATASDNEFGAVLGGQLIFNVALFIAAQTASVLTIFFQGLTASLKLSWWLLAFVVALALTLLLDLSYGNLLNVGLDLIVGVLSGLVAGLCFHEFIELGNQKEPHPE